MATNYDYVIVGAGPAGVQLAYYMEKAGRSYTLVERADGPGAFFRRFPRHRRLISSNKVYTGYTDKEVNLRFDWNSLLSDDHGVLFKEFSREYFAPADALVKYVEAFAKRYIKNVRYSFTIDKISRDKDGFRVFGGGEELRAKCVVLATGLSKPYVPRIEGIEHCDLYTDVSVNPDDFADKRVLVVGKGNSGFEIVDALIPTTSMLHIVSPESIKFAWDTHFPGHLRALNNNFLDTYQLKTQNAVLDARVRKIRKLENGKLRVSFGYAHAEGEVQDIDYDNVIMCTGFRFDPSIFDDSCRPARVLSDRFPEMTSSFESTNVPGLYFAGALTQSRDFKKTNSAFIHGFRYNARALFWLLSQRFHNEEIPHSEFSFDPRTLTRMALEGMNRSSALWQQFGFLCDVIVAPSKPGGKARYYEALPVDYVHESDIGRSADYYTITLEFGKKRKDAFAVHRDPDPDRADESFFLHPIVRRYRRGTMVRRVHLLEDLSGEWRDDHIHVIPLYDFFCEQVERHSPIKLDTLPPPAC